ncbi:MAG: tetratricopeptide repeat protein, partial [Candidatus Obscuribacterales bacterium]|nr:tetratricopeptide repeat protein [Candidatus Obscuribacterales bacterium]
TMLALALSLNAGQAAPKLLTTPPAAEIKDEGRMPKTSEKMRKREFTSEHLKLIRNLRITWVNCEAGAPMIDVERRYGSKRIYDDMARILDMKNPGKLSAEQVTKLDALDDALSSDLCALFLQYASIRPGKYKINNTMRSDFPDGHFTINDDGSGSLEIPSSEKMEFQLSDEHIKLLRRASWRSFAVDPKRPYGDMSYFYIDIADALGIPFRRDSEGRPEFSKETIKHMDRLHGESVFALQTFFKFAELEPCFFVLKSNEGWRKIDKSAAELEQDEEALSANLKLRLGSIMEMLKSTAIPWQNASAQKSIEATTLLIQQQPENPLVYATRASYYKQSGNLEKAIEDYSKAIELGKGKAQLACMWHESRAQLYEAAGRSSDAIADLDEVIRLMPQYVPAYYYRGRIYNSNKEMTKALSDFNFVIESNPHWNADIYYSRGVAHLALGDAVSAASDFNTYLESDKWGDQTAPYAVLLGYCALRKAGKPIEAQSLLSRADEKLHGDSYPNAAIQYLRSKITEDKLLSIAANNDELTEVHWYIAAKMLFDSRIEDAKKHLRWVIEHGNKSFLDYELAKNEFAKL